MFFTSSVEKKMSVLQVIVHPGFNHTHFFNDISILVMTEAVTYTTHIRSVCLWSGDMTDSATGERPGLSELFGINVINREKLPLPRPENLRYSFEINALFSLSNQ